MSDAITSPHDGFNPLAVLAELAAHRAASGSLSAAADGLDHVLYDASAAESVWLDGVLLRLLAPDQDDGYCHHLVGETTAGLYLVGRQGWSSDRPRIFAAFLPTGQSAEGVMLFDARLAEAAELDALVERLDGVVGAGRQYRSEVGRLLNLNWDIALSAVEDHVAGRWHGASPPVTSVSPLMASRERILACGAFWACDGAGDSVH